MNAEPLVRYYWEGAFAIACALVLLAGLGVELVKYIVVRIAERKLARLDAKLREADRRLTAAATRRGSMRVIK